MMAKSILQWTLPGLIGLALTQPLQAKPKDSHSTENWIEDVTGLDLSNGKKKKHKDQWNANDAINAAVSNDKSGKPHASSNPLQAIRDYIFGYQKDSGKSKSLPPGLAKKVARGGELPPGWQKKVYPGTTFPQELFPFASPLNYSQVPRYPNSEKGVDYYSIGNRLVKMNRSDNRILDVFDLD